MMNPIPGVPSPYLLQLEIIDGPVPDFTATLTTRDEQSEEDMSDLLWPLPESPRS
jgi:hypothetical protein